MSLARKLVEEEFDSDSYRREFSQKPIDLQVFDALCEYRGTLAEFGEDREVNSLTLLIDAWGKKHGIKYGPGPDPYPRIGRATFDNLEARVASTIKAYLKLMAETDADPEDVERLQALVHKLG